MNELNKQNTGNRKLTQAEQNEKAIKEKLNASDQPKNHTTTTPEQKSDLPPQEQTIGIP